MSTKKSTNLPAKVSPSQNALAAWSAHKEKFERKEEITGGQKISTQGRLFSIGGKKIGDGKSITAIILQFSAVKKWYIEKWSEDSRVPPACFALGMPGEELVPHENAADKQSATCGACQHNVFGSAETGKGKACADVRRLVLLTSTELADKKVASPENTTLSVLEIPPTGLANWKNFYRYTEGQGLPVAAFVVEITFDEQQVREIVKFTPRSIVENPDMIKLITSMMDEAEKLSLRPWQKQDSDQPTAKVSPKPRKSAAAPQATALPPAAKSTGKKPKYI